MSSRPRGPWGHRAAPVEAVTHEAQPSGLVKAWRRMGQPRARVLLGAGGGAWFGEPIWLVSRARDALRGDWCDGPACAVRALADALDELRPAGVEMSPSVSLVLVADDDEPAAYRWPDSVTGWAGLVGGVEDVTALAAMAVGVALWSRLPTAEEVAAWMGDDERVAP